MSRILFVDDEVALCDLMKSILESEGKYEVTTVLSGEEAVEAAAQDKFDLVITDFEMPGGMNGKGVLEEMRKINPNMPVIIFTAYLDAYSRISNQLDVEADAVIGKPIDHKELKNVVQVVLRKRMKGA